MCLLPLSLSVLMTYLAPLFPRLNVDISLRLEDVDQNIYRLLINSAQ